MALNLVTAINLPALLPAFMLALLFAGHTLVSYFFGAPLVIILWYWIGCWIDRRRGFLPVARRRPAIASRRRVAVVLSSLLFLLTAGFWVYYGLIEPHGPDMFWATCSMMCWSAFLLIVIISGPAKGKGIVAEG